MSKYYESFKFGNNHAVEIPTLTDCVEEVMEMAEFWKEVAEDAGGWYKLYKSVNGSMVELPVINRKKRSCGHNPRKLHPIHIFNGKRLCEDCMWSVLKGVSRAGTCKFVYRDKQSWLNTLEGKEV